jgi:hypothetical protein
MNVHTISKRRTNRRSRKGLGTTEWVVLAAALALAVVAAVTVMGRRVDGELSTTSQDVADPTRLTTRFGP